MKGKREPYSNRETPIPADAFTCEQCGWTSATGRTECPYCIGIKCRDCQEPRPCPCDDTRERLEKEQEAWAAGKLWCHQHRILYQPEEFCRMCDPRGDEEPTQKPWSEEAETTEAWEERRRGVTLANPSWQRQVLAHLDEALPSLYQAVLLCKDKLLLSALCTCIEVLRRAEIDLEKAE